MAKKRISAKEKRELILKEQDKIKEKWDEKIQDILKDVPPLKQTELTKKVYKPQLRKALYTIEQENYLKNKLSAEEQWVNNYFINFNTSKKINFEYFDALEKLLLERGITQELFMEKMMCERMAYWRFTHNIPSLEKLTAFCVVFNIDIQTLSSLLLKLGVTFKLTDPVNYAYYKLVEDYKGHSIYECNLLLKQIGISDEYLLPDPLAQKNIKKTTKK